MKREEYLKKINSCLEKYDHLTLILLVLKIIWGIIFLAVVLVLFMADWGNGFFYKIILGCLVLETVYFIIRMEIEKRFFYLEKEMKNLKGDSIMLDYLLKYDAKLANRIIREFG